MAICAAWFRSSVSHSLSPTSSRLSLSKVHTNGWYPSQSMKRNHFPLQMSFGSAIAEKLGGVMEILVGQNEITEKNIEDTLRV